MTDISITPSTGENISYDPVAQNYSIETPAPQSITYNLEAVASGREIASIDFYTTDGAESDIDFNTTTQILKIVTKATIRRTYLKVTYTDRSEFCHALGFESTEPSGASLIGMNGTHLNISDEVIPTIDITLPDTTNEYIEFTI